MKTRPLSVTTSNEGWMRRIWDSVWSIGVGKFENQAGFAEGYGMKPSPELELGRINGKLVLMGRNQTMKMLIQAPHTADDSLMGVRPKTRHQ